jgi:aryl-alcohol dehydrogenase-like predicted oxidoreductase
MTRERISKLPEDDWRKHSPDFNEPKLSSHLRLVEHLREIGERHDRFAGAVAVAWTLRHPAVTAAIVGARKPEQVDDVVVAGGIEFTKSDLEEIEAVAELAN